MMETITIGGLTIEVRRKRIRRVNLHVEPSGHVWVSTPARFNRQELTHFLLQHLDWVAAQQARYAALSGAMQFETGDTLPIWGKPRVLCVAERAGKAEAQLAGEEIHLTVPQDSTLDARRAVVQRLYRTALEERLPQVLPTWESRVGKRASSWHIRDMRTRWGSCNIRTARLCFNLQLAKKPPDCLDYVVVHELNHLYVAGHNEAFWHNMDDFFPDWREVRRKLNDRA